MNIVVNSAKENRIIVLFLFLATLFVASLFYESGASFAIILLFVGMCGVMIIRYWIAIDREILLSPKGMEIKFLWYKKKFAWDQIAVKRLFENESGFGYRIAYSSGMELSFKKRLRPFWLKPIQYCFLLHPLSYVVIHFPVAEQVPIKYPAVYEVDKNQLIEAFKVWGIEYGKTVD